MGTQEIKSERKLKILRVFRATNPLPLAELRRSLPCLFSPQRSLDFDHFKMISGEAADLVESGYP